MKKSRSGLRRELISYLYGEMDSVIPATSAPASSEKLRYCRSIASPKHHAIAKSMRNSWLFAMINESLGRTYLLMSAMMRTNPAPFSTVVSAVSAKFKSPVNVVMPIRTTINDVLDDEKSNHDFSVQRINLPFVGEQFHDDDRRAECERDGYVP